MANDEQRIYTDTFFARQPIFNAKKAVWGYELLYRGSADDTYASFNDNDVATLTVISNAIMNLKQAKQGGKVLIHFTQESIFREIPWALPSETTAVEVSEDFCEDIELLRALLKLKKEKYLIVVNNFTGDPKAEKLYKLCDMAFIDFLGKEESEIQELVNNAKQYKFLLAAKRVEEVHQFELATKLGFALFQGFFFEKPVIVPGRKLSSNHISRFMLFKVLEKQNPEFDELAKVIQSDVSISYRLLSFINSAAFGFSRKVESIKQALVLLGWKQIRSWLWLVILTDISPDEKTSELPHLSVIRAKFLECAARNHKVDEVKTDSLYLLGLFSLLEAMLDTPMSEIAENLPLEDRIRAALCQQQNEYTPWLELARSFERGDWDKLDGIIEELDLDPMVVANSYSEALVWAKNIHEQITGQ